MTISVTLTDLLPSTSYLLAYALPLLLLSLILTFAGAFLTLDRSRSFVPNNKASQLEESYATPKRRHFRLYLEGGVGGILIGYCFGLHTSTLLSLLIPNVSSSAALTYKSFVAVWFLSSIPTAILAGRFKYAALALSGITGGLSLALGLSIAFHPALLTRRILVALLVPICTLLTVLPVEKLRHHSVRLSANSTGAFGLVMSIALFAHVSSWADIWERLWISDGENWGTSAEHGLTAAFWLFTAIGCAADFLLSRTFGGNPDERWDSYLADYANTLPSSADRAGVFQPDNSSFWDRLFHTSGKGPSSMAPPPPFPPSVSDSKLPLSPDTPPPSFSVATRGFVPEAAPLTGVNNTIFEYEKKPGLLRKPSDRPLARLMALTHSYSSDSTKAYNLPHIGRKREAVKFRPLGVSDELSSDEEDEDSETKIDEILDTPPPKRRLSQLTSSTSSRTLTAGPASRTLSGSGKDVPSSPTIPKVASGTAQLANMKAGFDRTTLVGHSDVEEEEDVTSQLGSRPKVPGRVPPSIASQHRGTTDLPAAPALVQRVDSTPPPAGAVPMTPSLFNALDRVAAAQREAFAGANSSQPTPSDVTERPAPRNGQKWESFWQDVTNKAGEGARR